MSFSPSQPLVTADFQALFQAAPGLLAVVEPSDDYRIVDASDTYLQATNTRREAIVGQRLFDVFPANPGGTPSLSGPDAFRGTLESARRERVPATQPTYRYDIPRPEGGAFEERYWQTTVWPVPGDPSAPLRFLLCRTEDVTALVLSDREAHDTRSRLEVTLGMAEIGTWIWDVSQNRIWADANLASLFAVPTPDAAGGPIEHYTANIHEEDRARVHAAIDRTLREDVKFNEEYRIKQPDGTVRWVSARGWAERDENGIARRFPGVALDITERRRAEEALRVTDERLRMAVESASLGTWDFDPVSGALEWSDSCRAMFGLPPGTPVTYQLFLDILHPDDRSRADAAVQQALAPGGDGHYAVDYRTIGRTDGVERWIAARGRALFDARREQPLRFVGTVLDITASKRAEQAALRRSDQLQRLAATSARINSAHDVSSVLGVITAEARALIGARHAVVTAAPVGHPLRMAQPPVEVSSHVPGVENREPVASSLLAVPLPGHGGQPIGTIELSDKESGPFTPDDDALLSQLAGIAAGAIENARLYEELRANDKRKDEFLAMLAHELRNPLAAIRNAVALCGGAEADPADVAWGMEVIQRQIGQLSRLIDDLLDVSRITQGMVQLRKETIDMGTILTRAVETVRGLIDERRHVLSVSVTPSDDLHLEADAARLEQILVNLLTNAAKYTANGGEIQLRAAREDGNIVVRVRDNGVGIPPEKLPAMFELFAQGSRSLARTEGGLGIGLTVVRSLTELHGGSVHATSEGPGKGSEFIVRLPAARPAPPAPALSDAPSSNSLTAPVDEAGAAAVRVLVVDDNVDSARATARILARNGCDVQVAYDGPTAVEAAVVHQPAFVFLDIGLPGMSGYEVASRLRQEETLKDAMLVAVSGYGEESDRRRSREAGFDQHLVKPVDPAVLLALLRE